MKEETETNKIDTMHFIWVGRVIDDRLLKNIFDWNKKLEFLLKNRKYQIIIWTDEVEETIKKVLLKDVETIKVSNINNLDSILKKIGEQKKDLDKEFHLTDKDWEGMCKHAINNHLSTYEGRNYGISSDIYRMVALYKFGGVYMDCDNTPSKNYNEKLGVPNKWIIKKGELGYEKGFGNSYLVGTKDDNIFILILAFMTYKLKCTKKSKIISKDIEKQINLLKIEAKKIQSSRPILKNQKEFLNEINSLSSAWNIILEKIEDEISLHELQRIFPPVKLGDLQKRPDFNKQGKVCWNPRYKITTEYSGPVMLSELCDLKKKEIKITKVSLSGWVSIGKDHAWMGEF